MTKAKKAGCLVAAVAWCVILLILGVAYKFLVAPYFSEKLTDSPVRTVDTARDRTDGRFIQRLRRIAISLPEELPPSVKSNSMSSMMAPTFPAESIAWKTRN